MVIFSNFSQLVSNSYYTHLAFIRKSNLRGENLKTWKMAFDGLCREYKLEEEKLDVATLSINTFIKLMKLAEFKERSYKWHI